MSQYFSRLNDTDGKHDVKIQNFQPQIIQRSSQSLGATHFCLQKPLTFSYPISLSTNFTTDYTLQYTFQYILVNLRLTYIMLLRCFHTVSSSNYLNCEQMTSKTILKVYLTFL